VLEAARVYRLLAPNAIVISSGGLPDKVGHSSSETMRGVLVNLGVPSDHILLESQSRDTHDEAVLIRRMLTDLQINDTVLVTSDVHMRRSMGTFLAAGIVATPAIAPDPGPFETIAWWTPSYAGLQFSAYLVHELLGLPYYWLRGWWRRA
jgi:uncharacterized SAM-binding protein YcdF (DUF218 family)